MNYPITFGKYQLLERVNIGGMAEVFRAKAFGIEGFERILAIKRILPNMADDDEFINMFVDEARIAVQLNHPNIVQIYELGKFENQYYIAMEFVSGRDLRQILDRFRKRGEILPLSTAAFIASRLCEGLEYAHRRVDASGRAMNLIHRDVSPQNVLVGFEGDVKITDFGIAKAEDRASKTQAGVLKGKFGYMSPEQVRGLEIDRRSDVFAIGILLYEMVTGKRLFLGQSDFSTLEKVRNAEVTPPCEVNPQVSEALQHVMLKALARDRDQRYQWASELQEDLQQFLIQDGTTIYNTKHLAAFVSQEYAEELQEERRKTEGFASLPPPMTPEALSAAAQMRSAPTGDWASDGEKTMIFESGFGDVPDTVAGGTGHITEKAGAVVSVVGDPRYASSSLPPTQGYQPMGPAASVVSMGIDYSVAQRPASRRHLGAAVFLGGAFVVLLGALVALVVGSSRTDIGTLTVTSQPEAVQLYLDENLVATQTPFECDVKVGSHTLFVRAQGYYDRAYRFEIGAGGRAQIDIPMEAAPQVPDASIVVVTDPPGASVRIGGLPQGTTPLTINGQDPSRPVTLEISKQGFETQVVSATFQEGQRRTKVSLALRAVGALVADGARLVGDDAGGAEPLPSGDDTAQPVPSPGPGPGPGPGDATATAIATATIIVQSRPAGASVFVNGTRKGNTPLTISGLDAAGSYELVLSKSGYRRYEQDLQMAGRSTVTVSAQLSVRPAPRAQACSGKSGLLSVMPVGVADCTVFVGSQRLGFAPMLKHESPSGHCPVEVKCGDGRQYRATLDIDNGVEEKLIIRPEDWN